MLAPKVTASYAGFVISAAQIRAARALLGWTQSELAAKAKISDRSVKRIEDGSGSLSATLQSIEAAFTKAGVIFLDPGVMREGGPGLRLSR